MSFLLHAALLLYANGDGFWGDHHDGGGWWIVMGVGMFLFWALVIVAIVLLVRWLADTRRGPGAPGRAPSVTAVEILERRLAEGEITIDEYRERRAELTRD